MKANITNLIKALEICATAHNAELTFENGSSLILISSVSVPVIPDVQMITETFFKNAVHVTTLFDIYTVVEVSEFKDEINTELLALALPYNSLSQF